MIRKERPIRTARFGRPSAVALLVVIAVLLPAAAMPQLPGFLVPPAGPESTPSRPGESPAHDRLPHPPTWAPDAWVEGRVDELSMLELSMLLAGASPGSPGAESLRQDLDRLPQLPPVYEEVARAMLEGLARAYWHQEMATRYLTSDQLGILRDAQAQGNDLDAKTEKRLAPVLARLDQPHILQAAGILVETGFLVEGLVAGHQALDERLRVADVLADFLGVEAGDPLRLRPTTPLAVAGRVQVLALLTDAERLDLAAGLAGAPDAGLAALDVILQALLPFTLGPTGDSDHLVQLGHAIDAASPTLEVWGAAADARLAWRAEQTPLPRLPDPDAERPPLRLALPDLGVQPPARPAPSLPDAVADLARAMEGDAAYAATEAKRIQAWLTPPQAEAAARVLDSVARYIRAEQQVLSTPAPQGFTADALARWAEALDDGDLPSPASPDGQLLVSSQEHLQALAGAAKALEELLAAAEAIPEAFAPQQSSTQSTTAVECPEGVPAKLRVLGYLALDLCGHNPVWTEEEAAMLLIDVGGDDQYIGRHASAPFPAQVGPNANNPDHTAAAPVSLLFDLDGSDTYDAEDKSCAHAAACPDRDDVGAADTTGVASRAPVAVLVDWQGDDATATNRFMAGDQSQAYAGPDTRLVLVQGLSDTNGVGDPDQALRRGVAVLVERIGSGILDSTYHAGDRSQASTLPGPAPDGVEGGSPIRHGSAALVRLVGSGSEAISSFTSGDSSQAAAGADVGPGPRHGTAGVAFFVNVAGRDAVSHDAYTAGAESQGSTQDNRASTGKHQRPLAFFADAAGPGSPSDDTYTAGEMSRGYGGPPVVSIQQPIDPTAIFLDGLVNATLLEVGVGVQVSVEPSSSQGSSNDQYNGLLEGHGVSFGFFADIGGQDTYTPADPDNPHQAPSMDLAGPSPDLGPGNVQTSLDDGPVPRNDAVWRQEQANTLTGVDLEADRDGDMVPDLVESLWQQFVGLWGADPNDPGVSPLPVAPRVLLDLEGADLYLDAPHGLLLTVGGQDHFGPGYRAALHFDLGGDDLHEGLAGAANSTAPGGIPLLSFHLDVRGDDSYVSDLPFNQGFGNTGTGLLFDLGGNDLFVAPHSAQGVGFAGGLGALVALRSPPPAADRNVFLVDGPPAHGTGFDGGVGVFVAAGEHNAAPNGTGPGDGTGLRVNPSDNQAPEVLDWALPEAVPAGVPAELSFSARDPDGDPLRLCFSIETAAPLSCTGWLHPDPDNVTQHATIAWDNVPVDGTLGQTSLDFPVTLEAHDPGGLLQTRHAGNVTVHNEPPRIGDLRGNLAPMVGQPAAFQVPFEPADDLLDPVILFGSPDDLRAWNATAVDWAALSSGGRASLPLSIGSSLGGVQKELLHEPGNLLDGEPATHLALHYTSQFLHDPIQVVVDFAGPRQVRQLEVAAHRPTGAATTQFELSMLRPGGALEPVGTLQVASTSANDPDILVVNLPDFPDVRGLVVRQVLPHGFDPRPDLDEEEEPPIRTDHVVFHHVRALGPGAIGQWDFAAQREVEYRVLDRFGGFNATTFTVDIQPDPDAIDGDLDLPPFIMTATINPRGQVRHASLAAAGEEYPFTVAVQRLNNAGLYEPLMVPAGETASLCVDWDDGSFTCNDVSGGWPLQWEKSHIWLNPGEYQINATVEGISNLPTDPFHVADISVERAFDLRSEDEPVLWLALDPLGVRTWYSGSPYLGIVDAAGNDRYTGAIAGPSPSGRPSIVVDFLGDDDYLSLNQRTQGYGDFGTAAVLMDLTGDDLYVAPGHAQGAATRLGVGVLVDLGGDDRYNPVASTHPDIVSGLPDARDAWLERPDSLSPKRAPLAGGAPDLVQGAAIDAVGLHITSGGTDMFHAGNQAQGYGAHERLESMEYAPRTADCPSVDEHRGQLIAWMDTESGADPPYPWCLAGLERGNEGNGAGFDPLRDISQEPCLHEDGGTGTRPCMPNISALGAFIDTGPRFGPSLGLHLRLDGAATYHGNGWLQGAAQGSGRGMLVDRDGAGLLLASDNSQAYSEDAIAALVLGGPAALRLGERGQSHGSAPPSAGGPEGVQTPQAIWIGPDDQDAACDDDALCGSPQEVPASLGPSIELTATSGQLVGGDWQATLSNEEVLQDVTYVVFATTTMRDGSECLAEPISPPTWVDSGMLAAGQQATLTLDLDEVLDDGPLHPAGCLQLFVYARATNSPGGWSMEMVQADLARPPSLEVSGLPDPAAGELTFLFTSHEPLAARTPPLVQYAFTPTTPTPGGHPNGGFAAPPISLWAPTPGNAGATAQATWEFSAGVAGAHTLWARTQWPDGPVGEWQELAQTDVVVLENNVGLSSIKGVVALSGGMYVPANSLLPAAGTVISPAGVEDVQLRLRDGQGGEVKLVRDGSQHAILSAQVAEPGARLTEWKLDVRPEATFSGILHVQGRVGWLDGGTAAWSDWQELATVHVDGEAPRVTDVSGVLGAATNQDSFPIAITMDLDDSLQNPSECPTQCPGAGIDVETLSVRLRAPNDVAPLNLVAWGAGPDGLETHWVWDATAAPPEGEYFVEVFARDYVGNQLATYPGARFVVDRQAPVFLQATVQLPDGQQAIKPGDEVLVSAAVTDVGAAGVHQVTAAFEDSDSVPLTGTNDEYEGTLTAPASTANTVVVRLEALDAAGNAAGDAREIPFHPHPPVVEPGIQVRAQSITVHVESSRDVELQGVLQGDGDPVPGVVQGGPQTHVVTFLDLVQDTEYLLILEVVDAAGWVVTREESVRTLPLLESSLGGLAVPTHAVSGPVAVHAIADCPAAVPATVTLLVSGGVALPAMHKALEPCEGPVPFTLELDTRSLPDGPADLVLTLDDGSRVLELPFSLQIDNTRPLLQTHIEGPAARNGWHNGTVVVRATAEDATNPVTLAVRHGDQSASQPGDRVTLSSDGVHEVAFTARDGATPSNEEARDLLVRVDRTPPAVDAAVATEPAATRDDSVPLLVTAQDPASGVESYRMRVAEGPWSPWLADAPTEAMVPSGAPEGQHWIDVEVRDLAGNVATATLSMVLDRTPPEVLGMRWAGAPTEGDPVLHLVAVDRLNGSGNPVGVDAVRFASPHTPDSWSPWATTGGIGTFAIPTAHTNGTHTLVQLRDRVGNLAAPVASPAIPRPEDAPAAAVTDGAEGAAPQGLVVRDPDVQPRQGRSTDPFAFSAVVYGEPSAVWLEVNGQRHAATPDGPRLGDLGRLYVATVTLSPTPFEDPYTYRFVVELGDAIVTTKTLPGPTVLAVGLAGHDDAMLERGGDRGIPGVPTLVVLAAIAIAFLTRRMRP